MYVALHTANHCDISLHLRVGVPLMVKGATDDVWWKKRKRQIRPSWPCEGEGSEAGVKGGRCSNMLRRRTKRQWRRWTCITPMKRTDGWRKCVKSSRLQIAWLLALMVSAEEAVCVKALGYYGDRAITDWHFSYCLVCFVFFWWGAWASCVQRFEPSLHSNSSHRSIAAC